MSNGAAPPGYLGAEARVTRGPAPELIAAGYALELADAPLLHQSLNLADLAHVVALDEAGVVPRAAAAALARTLLEWMDIPASAFPYDPLYGDAYNSRERVLESRLGPVAGWLHTGRTRREAGRIAFRLALRERLLDLHATVAQFVAAVVDRADEHATTLWADTSYLQPAQPSTFGHYLGAFAEEAARHLSRIEFAHCWADRSPAGSGGVGGTRVLVDRHRLAELLGFAVPGAHTRDAMWATDGLVDAVAAATQATTTVDRLAEDLEIFASPSFGYVTLDASLCRASVLMPQKRNPYALAVIRAGAGTMVGRTTGLLVTQRTPSARTDNWLHAYGEVASSLALADRLVALGAEVVRTLTVHVATLTDAAAAHFTGAADLAEVLVLEAGLDYRSAYRVVGRAVADAMEHERTSISAIDVDAAAEALLGHGIDVDPRVVDGSQHPASVVATRVAMGGAAPERVREHGAGLLRQLDAAAAWRSERRRHARRAEDELVAVARRLRAG